MERDYRTLRKTSVVVLAAVVCLTASQALAQVTPRPVTPLKDGDSVLFIGNSFSDWFGPLPSAINAIINASGSGLHVNFAIKVKGMGILKEYATWTSLGMVDEIRKGGWKYVVIQGWNDAIGQKDSPTSESGATIADYQGWPACQDTMLKYLRVLDAEVRAVGATTILYEPHVGGGSFITDLGRSNQTYALLKSQVSLFHAPIITAWDSLRYRYPTTVYDCFGSPGSFIDILYHDCGHQNANGMALDAMTFYTILTRRSASTLAPLLPMESPERYEEFAALAYKVGKSILTMNNCGFTDAAAPSVPAGLKSSNIMPDSYVLSWTASTDNVGVLGYLVYRDNVLIDTVAVPRCAIGGLAAGSTYSMKVSSFDSERNMSGFSSPLEVTTSALVAIDTAGALLKWDFRGLTGVASNATTNVMTGISSTAPSAVIGAGPVFQPINFGAVGFTMTGQTQTTLATAITARQYFTFTAAPLAGNKISIDSVQLRPFTQNRSRTFTLMSSVRGFTAGNEIGTITGTVSGNALQTIRVSGHDSVSSAIEFRLYVWGPNNSFESFGIGNRPTASSETDLLVWGKVKSSASAAFPTNLSTSLLTETGFTLHWNTASAAVSYEVFRNGVSIGTTAACSMEVTGVTINAVYAMTVTARNGAGVTSEPSLPLNVTVPDLTNPSVPQNLAVTGITGTSFILHWDASTDNVGVTRYEIFMDGNAYGNTIDGYLPVPYLTPNTSYSMTVRSRDAAGNVSAQSAALVVTTASTGIVRPSGRKAASSIIVRCGTSTLIVDVGNEAGLVTAQIGATDLGGRTIAAFRDIRPGQIADMTGASPGIRLVTVRAGGVVRQFRLLVE